MHIAAVELEKISTALGDCDQPCPGGRLQIITPPTVDPAWLKALAPSVEFFTMFVANLLI